MTLADAVELDDDIDYDVDDRPDILDRLGRLRDTKGVARIRRGKEAKYVLLRYADIREALLNEEVFSKSRAFRPLTFPFTGPNIQGLDGSEHRRQRALVMPAFVKKQIPAYVEPLFRPIAEALVDEFNHLGKADLVEHFARRYPLRITNELLGIPSEDEDWMEKCAVGMLAFPDIEQVVRATNEFTQFVEPIIEKRRANPGNDLISTLLTTEIDGEHLDHEWIVSFLRLLFPAGVDTIWLTLASMMMAVAEQPEIHDRLRANAEDRKWAVEESLRWSSAVAAEPRVTLQDVEVCGVRIPAGELVQLILPVGNRDPLMFENPDQWDIDRRPSEHLAFGLGPHLCLGAFLARGELMTALEVLLERLPGLRLAEPAALTGALFCGPRKVVVSWET